MSSRQHVDERNSDSWSTFVPESLLEQSRNPFDSTQIKRKSKEQKRNSLEKGVVVSNTIDTKALGIKLASTSSLFSIR